jgi:hypothetical protein
VTKSKSHNEKKALQAARRLLAGRRESPSPFYVYLMSRDEVDEIVRYGKLSKREVWRRIRRGVSSAEELVAPLAKESEK